MLRERGEVHIVEEGPVGVQSARLVAWQRREGVVGDGDASAAGDEEGRVGAQRQEALLRRARGGVRCVAHCIAGNNEATVAANKDAVVRGRRWLHRAGLQRVGEGAERKSRE